MTLDYSNEGVIRQQVLRSSLKVFVYKNISNSSKLISSNLHVTLTVKSVSEEANALISSNAHTGSQL